MFRLGEAVECLVSARHVDILTTPRSKRMGARHIVIARLSMQMEDGLCAERIPWLDLFSFIEERRWPNGRQNWYGSLCP